MLYTKFGDFWPNRSGEYCYNAKSKKGNLRPIVSSTGDGRTLVYGTPGNISIAPVCLRC